MDWNLVVSILQSVRDAAVIVLAGWLVYFSRTEVSALKATIESLQTENARLTAQTAPALATEHASMIRYAEDMTAQKQQLEAKLKSVGLDESKKMQILLLGAGLALIEAAIAVNKIVGKMLQTGPGFEQLEERGRLTRELSELRDFWTTQSQRAVAGEKVELRNLGGLLVEFVKKE